MHQAMLPRVRLFFPVLKGLPSCGRGKKGASTALAGGCVEGERRVADGADV